MSKSTDITNLTDAALDVFLDVRSGADDVDAAHLTVAERYAVAAALGWELDARTRYWAENAPHDNHTGRRTSNHNAEEMILAEQDAADFGEELV